jgi:hypothetical protein
MDEKFENENENESLKREGVLTRISKIINLI